MIRRAIVALSMLVASPAIAREQVVEATGVAPLSGDPAQARWRAIGDALRQAIASGGTDMRAATTIDRTVIRTAVMWATAKALVTGSRLTDDWRGDIGSARGRDRG